MNVIPTINGGLYINRVNGLGKYGSRCIFNLNVLVNLIEHGHNNVLAVLGCHE